MSKLDPGPSEPEIDTGVGIEGTHNRRTTNKAPTLYKLHDSGTKPGFGDWVDIVLTDADMMGRGSLVWEHREYNVRTYISVRAQTL